MSPEEITFERERAAYARIVSCSDPVCDPAGYALCAACRAVADAVLPARCPDPGCPACTAEAAGAER